MVVNQVKEKHVALLRGINVGGKNMLPMKELIKIFEAAGCSGVTSYINSGNIAFSATAAVLQTLSARVAADVAMQFGFKIPVVLRGRAEYPGGPITGGRIAFIAISDPARTPGVVRANHRGTQGDLIFPHRVKGLDAIYAKLVAAGFEILFAPRVTPSGLSRNMMVFDPNGHIVELFELK